MSILKVIIDTWAVSKREAFRDWRHVMTHCSFLAKRGSHVNFLHKTEFDTVVGFTAAVLY